MRKDVSTFYLVAGNWQACNLTWAEILEGSHCLQSQIIFTSLRDISSAPELLKSQILSKFGIPRVLLSRVCLESNGFAGCEAVLNEDGSLEFYNHWSRFLVKQVYRNLRPKPSFTWHSSADPNTPGGSSPIHGSTSLPNGWEWYEMGFLVHWVPPSSSTILCFDLPQPLQQSILKGLTSSKTSFYDPYTVFSNIPFEVISLLDASVWSIRDHICNWEAARYDVPDYSLLHELARHAIHVSETLSVALRSLQDIQQQRRDFMATYAQTSSDWHSVHDPFQFQLRLVESILSRSSSNKERLQNEIQLAFHSAAQRDSKIQVRIGERAKAETAAMKTIAIITMVFLPGTFLATIFSMPFFQLESAGLQISSQFWIYWVLTTPLTLLTLSLWVFWDMLPFGKQADN
ncbi:hypothetical protein B0I35DRAFT_509206 [Stachybotrys elegans]|uniref:Uncharacterized protein n=1 Tax=Stachybotrys elegans TaxID=80388 RepID=A0A8K0SXU3_9HYPO|nr:hypothetical protein B0I35DRAFT_509206 [Stachybotrys elegans]